MPSRTRTAVCAYVSAFESTVGRPPRPLIADGRLVVTGRFGRPEISSRTAEDSPATNRHSASCTVAATRVGLRPLRECGTHRRLDRRPLARHDDVDDVGADRPCHELRAIEHEVRLEHHERRVLRAGRLALCGVHHDDRAPASTPRRPHLASQREGRAAAATQVDRLEQLSQLGAALRASVRAQPSGGGAPQGPGHGRDRRADAVPRGPRRRSSGRPRSARHSWHAPLDRDGIGSRRARRGWPRIAR